jgi:hypothetical protein
LTFPAGRASFSRSCRYVVAAALLAGVAGPAAATPVEDAFIAGYAAAVLECDFRLSTASLTVHDGVVGIRDSDLAGSERARVVESLCGSAACGASRS